MLNRLVERVLLVCGGIALGLVAAEGLVSYGQRLPRAKYRAAMLEQATASEVPMAAPAAGEWSDLVIHPYLGFVPDPTRMRNHTTIGDPGQILPRSDNSLVVGVFGGSFAGGLCAYGGAELRRVLAPPGKEVRLLCVAAGGYKQPQQLLALTYLLAQGAHFDLVINVDGFNEVALPPMDNVPQNVNPIYPRAWFWLVGNVKDPAALKLLGTLSIVDRERKDWADRFVRWRLYHSSLLGWLWQRGDRQLSVRRDALLVQLSAHKIEQRETYASTGPPMTFPDEESLYNYVGRVWRDSSQQMRLLCDANGIAYHHFLQPNQHVPGSKPMGAEELRIAMRPGSYADAVVRGYPRLRQLGEELRGAGVRFHDLTMTFKDVHEPLYSDSCCHLSLEGYGKIARVIGDAIREDQSGLRAVPVGSR